MLKNINPEEMNNRSANSENIDDSQSQDENGQEPLCSFDISLNNGKKASLEINEGDNYEQKVKNFCEKYKISPQDGEVLLKRVKEEIDSNSNNNTNINDFKNNNKPIEEISNKFSEPLKENLYNGNRYYIPKEEKKLDHILNESESMSVSESVKKSQNNENNLIKQYNNINGNTNINNNYNNIKMNNNSNMNNNMKINNNTSVKPIYDDQNLNNNNNMKNINNPNSYLASNNNPYYSFSNPIINIPNNNNSNPNPNPSSAKFYRVKEPLKEKSKKKKNKQNVSYPVKNKTNQILYNNNNNNNIKTQQLNNTFQNNNLLMLNNSSNNYIQNTYDNYSFNPKRTKTTFRNSLVGQKIEFINGDNHINNKSNLKMMTPKTVVKYANPIYPTPKVVTKIKEQIFEEYPKANNINMTQIPIINKNETLIYNYDTQKIVINENNNYPIINNIDNPKIENFIEQPYTVSETNHNSHNLSNPKSVNINYENLNNNKYETVINPAIEYNINSPNYNTTNFETQNNNIVEYNNNYDNITNSPILNYDKYDSVNNQNMILKY